MDFGSSKAAYLILSDGTVFKGKSFGTEGTVIGETVFTTAMTGYQETLTDPSYCGQIVTQTFPLIGNYGVNSIDYESRGSVVSGYVVREKCDVPSNFRCEDSIESFLKKYGIIGIYDIDTRRLTQIIRETGVMNGMITTEEFQLEKALEEIKL
ncbi:MAG: carbamoyl phosphate synthase small subunit, partial [[Eubacterium] siraeum]|nr:carbamoyl phosphate synthase small subunit [[Eubacterium] siraeum]